MTSTFVIKIAPADDVLPRTPGGAPIPTIEPQAGYAPDGRSGAPRPGLGRCPAGKCLTRTQLLGILCVVLLLGIVVQSFLFYYFYDIVPLREKAGELETCREKAERLEKKVKELEWNLTSLTKEHGQCIDDQFSQAVVYGDCMDDRRQLEKNEVKWEKKEIAVMSASSTFMIIVLCCVVCCVCYIGCRAHSNSTAVARR